MPGGAQLEPLVAIVTNVEWEHVDVYPSAALVHAAFEEFAGKVRRGGLLLVCGDDPGARALAQLPLEGVRVVTYGARDWSDWNIFNLQEVCSIICCASDWSEWACPNTTSPPRL